MRGAGKLSYRALDRAFNVSIVVAGQWKPHPDKPSIAEVAAAFDSLAIRRLGGRTIGGWLLVLVGRSERIIARRHRGQEHEPGNGTSASESSAVYRTLGHLMQHSMIRQTPCDRATRS